MANGMITRNVFYARAYTWQIDGTNEDGSPRMVRVGDVDFVSTKPTQKEAYKALKGAGINTQLAFVNFDIYHECVIAMDLDTFILNGVEVDRLPNGKIKGGAAAVVGE